VKLQQEFTVSERRACQVTDQPRSSQRYEAKPRDDESSLVKRMFQLTRQRPRFGYRRIAALLRVGVLCGCAFIGNALVEGSADEGLV